MGIISFEKTSDLGYAAEVLESILPMYKNIIPGAFERQIEKFREWKQYPVNYELWTVYDQEEPIGFLGMESLNSEVVYLAAFYLFSDYHRMGLGSLALEALVLMLKAQEYRELLLFAHKEAFWAVNFYLKNGFEQVTDDTRVIQQYKGGILSEYFLPKPILMRRLL